MFGLTGFTGRNPSTPHFAPAPYRRPAPTRVPSVFNGSCSSVHVDCATHKIQIVGANLPARDRVIDCGRNGTTKNGKGTIGGPHQGRVVKDGVRIEGIIGMGDSGGGRVFHTAWWRPGQMPVGADNSKGCVHVSPEALRVLKSCKGAPLEITGGTTRSRFPKGMPRGSGKGKAWK